MTTKEYANDYPIYITFQVFVDNQIVNNPSACSRENIATLNVCALSTPPGGFERHFGTLPLFATVEAPHARCQKKNRGPQPRRSALPSGAQRARLEKNNGGEGNGRHSLDTAIQYDTVRTVARKEPRNHKPGGPRYPL